MPSFSLFGTMSFAEPEYDPEIVDAAGDTLIGYADAQEYLDDLELDPLDIINNWRAAHAYPLNTFQMTLRNRARQVDPQSIVAQRIKRLSSIEDKLRRYDWLKLSAMQDIAGCRVIVNTVSKSMNSWKVTSGNTPATYSTAKVITFGNRKVTDTEAIISSTATKTRYTLL